MGVFELIILVVVLGAVAWLIGILPIPQPFQQVAQGILVFILVIIVLVWLLNFFGVTHHTFTLG